MGWELPVEIREGSRVRREGVVLEAHQITLRELIRRRHTISAREMFARRHHLPTLEQALEAFQKNLFVIVLDGRRLMNLEEQITLTPLSRLIFWHVPKV